MKKILLAVITLMGGVIGRNNVQAQSLPGKNLEKATITGQTELILHWQKTFGGSETDRSYTIQPTSDGGYIIAGASSSNDIDFIGNNGGLDYRILKLDAYGNISWQKNYGGSGDDVAKCILQTSDGGYIVAGSSTYVDGDLENEGGTAGGWISGWVLKLDNTGTKSWGRVLQGLWSGRHSGEDHPAPCNINTVIETAGGEYVVGGNVEFSDWSGNGGSGSMIAKLDINGKGRIISNISDATITSIVETNTGFITAGFIAGYHQYPNILLMPFNSSFQFQNYFEYGGSFNDKAYSIQQTTDGGYILAGTSSSTDGDFTYSGNHGDADYCLIKLNSAYEIEWSKCFGGSGADIGNAVQQMPDSSFYIAGTSFSNDGQATGHSSNSPTAQADAWLIHVDHTGNFIWGKSYSGNNPGEANSMEKTPDGGLIIAGVSASTIPGSIPNGNDDFWVLKLAKPSVATGVPGSCTSFPSITINSSNNNCWVSITDYKGNAVAEIKANGNNLGIVTASVFINGGAIRKDKNNKYYLDRNITITPQVQPKTPVDVRLYIKATEYEALKNAANVKGKPNAIDSITDVKIYPANSKCSPTVTALGSAVGTVAEKWENDFVLSASVCSLSSFFFAPKTTCAPPIISNMLISTDTLWPPLHSLRGISVAYKTYGDCKCDPVTRWLTVKSNEPICGTGTADKSPDWVIVDANHVYLRAERSDRGTGRIYTITINAKNTAGAVSTYDFTVAVPLTIPAAKAAAIAAKDAVNGTSIINETMLDCIAVPNPSSDYFTLQILSSSNEKIEMAILDMSGRIIEKQNTYQNKIIRIGEKLKPGVYMIQLIQGDQQKTIKLVKQ